LEGREETTMGNRTKKRVKLSEEMLRARAEAYEVSEAHAKRQERARKFNAEKNKRIRKNRKNEWTVVWQGGAPQ
jgi:hypothetical protein